MCQIVKIITFLGCLREPYEEKFGRIPRPMSMIRNRLSLVYRGVSIIYILILYHNYIEPLHTDTMDPPDFSSAVLEPVFYGGSERKTGVRIGKQRYIMKYRTMSEFGPRFNHVSEHLGSRIFSLLGIESQGTQLGTYRGEEVVLCRNFLGEGEQFVPFNDVGESSLDTDSEHHRYTYGEIVHLIEANRKLTDVADTRERFWDIFVVDALLGNFDRHGGNWGFVKKDNRYRLSPVFDNGSCLFPQMNSEEEMLNIIGSPELTDDRVYRFPTSQIKLDGRKSSYHEVIGSLGFPECNDALRRIVPRIDLGSISELVDGTCFITDIHKQFYKHMIRNRYEKILLSSLERLEAES